MGQQWVVNSEFTRDQFLEHAAKLYDENKYITLSWKVGRQRSNLQNNALHLYCEQLAQALNDAGLDMRKVLKEETEIPWNQRTVKEYLWRPIQEAVLGVSSTTEPKRDEYPKVYEVLHRHLAQKLGITVPWPSREDRAA